MAESKPTEEQHTPIKGSCHCGAVTFTVSRKPYHPINDCQCSICRRYGAAWAYYKKGQVEIEKKEGTQTRKYVWGDKMVEFHFCEDCGNCVYWWPIAGSFPEGIDEMGVNTKMMDPEAVWGLNRRVTYQEN